MATDRDGNYKPSPALDRYTVEGERLRLQNPALTEVQRRQTRIHLRALQRADKERGERLKAQREEEARRLQQRRAEARDNRAATWTPTWSEPAYEPPRPVSDYGQDGNPYNIEGGEHQ